MTERALRVGECVTTPRGFVAEVVSLTADRALIRYLGKHRPLGEMELQLALLRPATAHDMVQAGIHYGDPHAPSPKNLSTIVREKRFSRRRPHGDAHNEWRSKRNRSPADNPSDDALQELISALMKEHCTSSAG
jgi:hypothetical protein